MLINPDSTMSDSDNEVGDMQMECRACLKFLSKGYDIFQPWNAPWVGMRSTVADDLATIANIVISESDPHSRVMCNSCCIQLHNACRFISTVNKTNDILKLRLPYYEVPIEIADKPWPKPIQLEKNINGSIFKTTMDVEVKQELLSDDDMVDLEDGFTPDSSVEIKVEPEEIVEPPPIKVTVNGTITSDNIGSHNIIISNGCAIYEDEEYLDAVVKEEPPSEDEQVPYDLSPECMLCSKTFSSISGLKAHVISQHSYKGVRRRGGSSPERRQAAYTCGACGRSFVTSTDLMVHETCHNKSVCYSCSAHFDTFKQLTRHRKRCKAIANKEVAKPKMLEDVVRQLPPNMHIRPVKESILKKDTKTCPICLEEFSDAYYMKIHHEIHHTNSSEPTAKNENIETEELEKGTQTKKSVMHNKLETENLQRMFEHTEISNIKVILFRKENRDSDSSESSIEITSKTDQKQIKQKEYTNKDRNIQEDKSERRNYAKKQGNDTKQKSKHIEDMTLVKCEEGNEVMDQNDRINYEHLGYHKQAEKNDKDEVKHNTKNKKGSEQTDNCDKNKEQISSHVHLENQESNQLKENEKTVCISTKQFKAHEQDKLFVAESEKSEESQNSNKQNIDQIMPRECSEQAEECQKTVKRIQQFGKSEPEENVAVESEKSEDGQHTNKGNIDQNVFRERSELADESKKVVNIIKTTEKSESERKNVAAESEKSEESQHKNMENIDQDILRESSPADESNKFANIMKPVKQSETDVVTESETFEDSQQTNQESIQAEESKNTFKNNKRFDERQEENNIEESEKNEKSQLEHDYIEPETIESVSEEV